jgi:putative hydrolase of the HAD superfamily
MMLDLDNTLIDRDAAFETAAGVFLEKYRLPSTDLAWLMEVDAGGYTPRADVAAAIVGRFGAAAPGAAVARLLDRGGADHVVLEDATRRALLRATAAGWSLVVVTNGTRAQQEAMLRTSGLDRLVDGWVISEAAGCRKPSAAIFTLAAEAVHGSLEGAWMIGDSPHADIAGAAGIRVSTVWVSAGRPWPDLPYRPTQTAEDVATAIELRTTG